MSAIVNGTTVRQLERPTSGDESVTEEDAADRAKLARLLARMLRDVATLKRRFWPRAAEFEDVAVDATGATKYRFEHGFGGRVRYTVVEQSGFASAPNLNKHADTDASTLVLTSTVAGTLTLRIVEAG